MVMTKSLLVACLMALPSLAQSSSPFVPGAIYVVHSATRRTAQTPETGLAPGSLCDIDITGLYPPFGTLSPDDKATLRFRPPGATDARELGTLTSQASFGGYATDFTALIPSDTPLGQAEVLAVTASGKSFSATVWIAASDFGVFTKAGAGYDAAVAQVWRNTPTLVSLTRPAQAGDWVTLWGTGLGSAASTVQVNVAGIGVAPVYAGPAPGLPGVDQINFQFPAGVPDDCYIPLAVEWNGRLGNFTSIAASSGPGACHHRLGLSSDALAMLDRGGQVSVSQSWVHSDVMPNPVTGVTYQRYDTVSLDFWQYDAAGVQLVTGLWNNTVAGCQLDLNGGTTVGFVVEARPFDAGRPVVTGPGGVRIVMDGDIGHYSTAPSDTSYPLASLPASPFVAGDWAVEAPGGMNGDAFRTALRVPAPLQWLNRARVSPVSRTSDLTLEWDATGYTNSEWMRGSVGVGAASVTCQAPATAGSITIPASLIAQLPAATNFTPLVELLLTPDNRSPLVYSAPVVGGAAFPGVATFSYLEAVSVALR